jgi:hypothetical protein
VHIVFSIAYLDLGVEVVMGWSMFVADGKDIQYVTNDMYFSWHLIQEMITKLDSQVSFSKSFNQTEVGDTS